LTDKGFGRTPRSRKGQRGSESDGIGTARSATRKIEIEVGLGGRPRFEGHGKERGTEARKAVTKRGPRRVRMREYSVRRNLGLLLNSLAGGRALNIYEGTLA